MKMRNITIESASFVDKEQLAETFQYFNIEKIMMNRAECYLSHNNTILAKDGNKIIGKMLWHIKQDPNVGVAEFEELYVFEDYRRKEIGSELVEFSINAVRRSFEALGINPRRIYLFTNENNQSARNLYEKFGFECIANFGHLFSENENELFYILDLTKNK
jgi:ribosomal protein S18 acetylase RimI-like enzyme